MQQHADFSTHIKAAPDAVLGFIADVRNRTRYLPSLKALTDIEGEPAAAGTTWRWKFALLGREFEGTARSLLYEPGRRYSFRTEGGLESTWNYKVEPEGSGTRLSIHVEYFVPAELAAQLPAPEALDAMKKAEAERVFKNLKGLLEQK